jgi:hypothetical protein
VISLKRSGRECIQEEVCRAGSTADRATAPVEESQSNARVGSDLGHGFLGLVEAPLAGHDAAILVAVAVADHDLLDRHATVTTVE